MKRLLLTLLLLLAAASLLAADDPVTDRGFKAGAQYDFHDIDAVNAFNGNLSVRIPLGQRYATNGSLAYQFTLSYNSSIWDWSVFDVGSGGTPRLRDMVFSNMYILSQDGSSPSTTGNESFPSRASNAGLGWTASLGELHEALANQRYPFAYTSEDGSSHGFYTALHGTATLPASANASVLYSRDGSYIRLVAVETVNSQVQLYEVQLPNGIHKRFRRTAWPVDNVMPRRWLLESISDPFGNVLWVERTATPAPGGLWTWTYKEGTVGADRYVNYPAETPTSGQIVRTHVLTYRLQKFYDLRLEQLDLASSAGVGSGSIHLTYENAFIPRAYGSTWADPATVYVPWTDVSGQKAVAVSLLKQIDLPAGGGSWTFQYVTATDDLLPINWNSVSNPFTYYTSAKYGRLERINLPTGGGISYTYGSGNVPAMTCPVQRNGGLAVSGVTKRQQWKSTTVMDGDPWLYIRSAPFVSFGSNCAIPREWLSATIDPFGRTDLAYYSIFVSDAFNPEGWDQRDYGMNFSRYEKDSAGRFVSSQTFQCNDATFSAASTAAAAQLVRNMLPRYAHSNSMSTDWSGTTCGAPLRSHYVVYEPTDADCDPEDGTAPCWRINPRIQSESTVYRDDPNTNGTFPTVVVDHPVTSFDGLGHYRQTTTSSTNFKYDVLRVEKRNWNPLRSVTNIPATNQPWMLERYDTASVEEGITSKASVSDFDQTSGFLKAVRTYASGLGPSQSDVLTTYERVNGGFDVNIDTKSYGGDVQGLPANSGTAAPGTLPEYWSRTTLRYGGLAQKQSICTGQPVGCSYGVIALTAENNAVNASDGHIASTAEPSGLVTTMTYDGLGRIKTVVPAQGAQTTYVYIPYADMNNPSRITATQDKNGTRYGYAEYAYDHLGRLASEKHQFPGSTQLSLKTWSYRPTGELLNESTTRKEQDTPFNKRYEMFDVFGRPGRTLPPDGGANGKRVEYTYFGIQQVKERTFNVATALGVANGDIVTWRTKDALGRLRRVEETSLSGSPQTEYTWDATDQLRQVTAGSQQRFFIHDGRGMTTKQNDPELLGVAVNFGYDSRGHLRSRRVGNGSSNFDLAYFYDAAERLTTVTPFLQPGTPLKEYFYYPDNSDCTAPGGYAKGKLRTAVRHNFVRDPSSLGTHIDYLVTEHYRYEGVDGRVSFVETTLGHDNTAPQTGAPRKFQTSYTYDPLGNVTSTAYPVCDGCGDNGLGRVVSNTYSLGYLTGVTGFADSFTYHPNGLIEHFRHTNGVEDWQEADDTGLRRPKSISMRTGGLLPVWKNGGGNYTYDGAGNVTTIGNDLFQYDGAGRLTASRVGADQSGGGGVQQAFTYDRFGNLGIDGATKADANNRLTDASYDEAGNVTQLDGYAMEYDAFNQLTYIAGNGQVTGKEFVYSPSDERVGVWDFRYGPAPGKLRQLFTLRDASGHVLRDFERVDGAWHWLKDYVWRGPSPLGSVTAAGVLRHFTLDHLGTPRLLTDQNGSIKSTHTYAPFGSELTLSADDGERLKFTSHERDENDPTLGTQAGDVDYMHARYFQPTRGRLFSLDPVTGVPEDPQSWNRYAYVRNDPIGFVDATGMQPGDLVGRINEYLDRFKEDIEHFNKAADAEREIVIFRVSLRVGPRAEFKAGPLTATAELDAFAKANVNGKVTVEGRAQVGAGVAGTDKNFRAGGKATLTVADRGQMFPNGVRPELKGGVQTGTLSANTSTEISARVGAGIIGVDLGFNYGKLGTYVKETIAGVDGVLSKLAGGNSP